MGSLWSQPQPPPQQQQPLPNNSSLRKRKRPLSITDQPPTSPELDPTPDGETHRYIVRCSSIFWSTKKDITKLLSKIPDFPPHRGVHKVSKWDHFFIAFPNRACAQNGVKLLNAQSFRGVSFEASPTAEHSSKRIRIDHTIAAEGQSSAPASEAVCKTAADVTAKWRHVPYEEQLRRKRHRFTNALALVSKHLRKELKGREVLPWLTNLYQQKQKGNPPCCPLIQLVGTDEHSRRFYRNKNEFTVGMPPNSCGVDDMHRSELVIGYALGLVRDGSVSVGEVDENCVTTSETARGVARCLTPVMRSMGLQPYDKRSHEGYWRQITCREGTRTGQVVVCIVVNPEGVVEKDKECRKVVVNALKEWFGEREFGVYWQASQHASVSSDIPALHLYGLTAVVEELCGLKFRVAPTAFFQVNTVMAERLYEKIGELAGVTRDTVLFDVCCGTGTIGLSLANKVHSVVGIEMNEAAVRDAEYNARLNGVKNAMFVVGKVEERIHDAIQLVESRRECVVVLDPPRAGVSMNVVAAVRAMRGVRKVVYVACEPNNFWRNALGFCRPRSKAFRLEPFVPVRAMGIDLFPHTDHGELAVLLERERVEEGE